MSLMLTYKAIFQTAQLVSMQMGAEIQTKLGGHFTSREEAISARPLDYAEVAIFNPQGGYGSFILPGVLMLILQQTLVLGIGMSAGTARESNRYHQLIPITRPYQNVFRIVLGKALCYFMIYAIMGAWLVIGVPRLFHFPQLATWQPLLTLMLPYTLACIFFGIVVSCIVRYRENVMLLMVFISVPLLFLSGVSWPQSNISGFWQGVSWVFPSTFGIKAYVRLNSMGGTISDVSSEIWILWLHVFLYFWLACVVYGYQIYLARHDAFSRYLEMKKRKQQKQEE
jgi:ABC-2 type transport system permease protein